MQKDFSKNKFSELQNKDLHENRQEFEKIRTHYGNFLTVLPVDFIDLKEPSLQFKENIPFLLLFFSFAGLIAWPSIHLADSLSFMMMPRKERTTNFYRLYLSWRRKNERDK